MIILFALGLRKICKVRLIWSCFLWQGRTKIIDELIKWYIEINALKGLIKVIPCGCNYIRGERWERKINSDKKNFIFLPSGSRERIGSKLNQYKLKQKYTHLHMICRGARTMHHAKNARCEEWGKNFRNMTYNNRSVEEHFHIVCKFFITLAWTFQFYVPPFGTLKQRRNVVHIMSFK